MESKKDVPPEKQGAGASESPGQLPENQQPWLRPVVAGGMAGVIFLVHGAIPRAMPDAIPSKTVQIVPYGWDAQGGQHGPEAPREHTEITASNSSTAAIAPVWGHPLDPYADARAKGAVLETTSVTDTKSGQILGGPFALFTLPRKLV